MFKIKNGLAPILTQELFPVYDNKYNLRSNRCWETHNVKTVGFGKETLLFRGQKPCQLLPESIKKSKTLVEFKSKVKVWRPEGCACRLCQTYITWDFYKGLETVVILLQNI